MAAVNSTAGAGRPARSADRAQTELSKPMAAIVAGDLQKDLTKVPDHELTEHLVPAR